MISYALLAFALFVNISPTTSLYSSIEFSSKKPYLWTDEKNIQEIDLVKPVDGVSHNQLSTLTVPKEGIFLNNEDVQASTILLEITNFETVISGPIKIIGKPAQLIISSKHGFQCFTCTLDDAPETILTTKSPHRVQTGGVEFLGDAASSIKITGSVIAQNLSLNAGHIALEGNLTVYGSPEGKNPHALHVSAGTLLNAPNSVIKVSGDLQLNAQGTFSNHGYIHATGTLTLSSDFDVINTGFVYSEKTMVLQAEQSIANKGFIHSNDELICQNKNGGKIVGQILNESGNIISLAGMTLRANTITNTRSILEFYWNPKILEKHYPFEYQFEYQEVPATRKRSIFSRGRTRLIETPIPGQTTLIQRRAFPTHGTHIPERENRFYSGDRDYFNPGHGVILTIRGDEIARQSPPGTIHSGGKMNCDTLQIKNLNSHIYSGDDIFFMGAGLAQIENISSVMKREYIEKCNAWQCHARPGRGHYPLEYVIPELGTRHADTQYVPIGTSIASAKTIHGHVNKVNVSNLYENHHIVLPERHIIQDSNTRANKRKTMLADMADGLTINPHLFYQNNVPGDHTGHGKYAIMSRFSLPVDNYCGTEYALQQMGLPTDHILASPLYESMLIRNAILNAAGHMLITEILESKDWENKQRKKLFDNGIELAQRLQLSRGKPLPEEYFKHIEKPALIPEITNVFGDQSYAPVLYLPTTLATYNGAYFAALNRIDLTIKNDLVTNGLIKAIEGTIDILAQNIFNQGGIEAAEDISLEAAQDIIHEAIVQTIWNPDSISTRASGARTRAGGTVSMTAQGDLVIKGSEIRGDTITLKTLSGKIVIVPVTLYNSYVMRFKKGHHAHASTTHNAPLVVADGGDLLVDGHAGIHLEGAHVSALGTGYFATEGELVTAPSYNEEKSEAVRKTRTLTRSKTERTNSHSTSINPTTLTFGQHFISHSGKDTILTGTQVQAKGYSISAGSTNSSEPDLSGSKANVVINAGTTFNHREVQTREKQFGVIIDHGHLQYASQKDTQSIAHDTALTPTVIEVEGECGIYATGKITVLASTIQGDKVVLKADEGITLGVQEYGSLRYIRFSKSGVGVGLTANGDEVSISFGARHEHSEDFTLDLHHIGSLIKANELVVITPQGTYHKIGSVTHAPTTTVHAKNVIEEPAYDTHYQSHVREFIDAGIKAGFLLPFGEAGRHIHSAAKADLTRPEGLINAASSAEQLGQTAKNTQAQETFQFGVWAYFDWFRHDSDYSSKIPVVSATIAEKQLTMLVEDDISLEGSQWKIGSATLEVGGNFINKPAYETHATSGNADNINAQIGLYGPVQHKFTAGTIENKTSATFQHNSVLTIAHDLNLKVKNRATLSGINITAQTIKAAIGELVLESVLDTAKNNAYGLNLSLNPVKAKATFAGSVMIEHGSKSWISRMTSIISREEAEIIVDGVMKISSAMIATAERNEDGSYTDQGLLKIRAAKLIAEEIEGCDKNLLMGIGWQQASNSVPLQFGALDREQTTKPTLGRGNIRVDGKELNTTDLAAIGINQDLNHVQHSVTNVDVRKIDIVLRPLKDMKKNLQALAYVTEVLTSVNDRLSKQDPSQEFDLYLTTLDENEASEDIIKLREEAKKAYIAGREIGLSPKAALFVTKQMVRDGLITGDDKNANHSERVNITRIDITKRNLLGSESFTIACEHYGTCENIPQDILDKVDSDYLAYKQDGQLKFAHIDSALDAVPYHERLITVGYKAGKFLEYAANLEKNFGTPMRTAIAAVNAMSGGLGRVVFGVVKDVVGEALFAEYIAKGYAYLTDAGVASINKIDPYLSDEKAQHLVTIGLAVGALTTGVIATTSLNHYLSQPTSVVSNVKIDRYTLNLISDTSKRFLSKVHIYGTKKAEAFNDEIKRYYPKPPFMKKTTVMLFKTDAAMKNQFVRGYYCTPDGVCSGQFIVLYDDLFEKGRPLTQERFKSKFDVPDEMPTHFSWVNPPEGTKMAAGIVQPKNFAGKGKGTQFYFNEEAQADWFDKPEPFDNLNLR